MTRFVIPILTASLLGASAIAQSGNIVEVAAKAGKFNTLLTAAKAAGLAGALSGKGPFTVFAPTDAAFAKLGDAAIGDLLKPENKDKLAGDPQVPRRRGQRPGLGRDQAGQRQDAER